MTRAFWAPGRVNLIGEHTDYSGGLSLPAALELGIRIEGDATAGPSNLSSDAGDAQRYVDAVTAELDALGRPSVGFAGRIESTLPIGTGLSSSAALEVAIALALSAVAEFPLEPLELALLAQRSEHRATGMPCGIMDQAASVLGRADHAILLDSGSLAYEAVPLPPELALVIVDSGVRRRLEDSGYAARRAELERGLAGADDPTARRRVRHVETENERVREVVAILRAPDIDVALLGELFREGHASLRDDFEVSTPELDELVALAYRAGAAAARMTGGGFGGSIVALVECDRAQAVADDVAAAYRGVATAYVTRAADGAREL